MEWNFRTIAIANLYLCNPNIAFVVTNDDPAWRSGESGRLMPDIGALLAGHEVACGRTAFRVGKPATYAFDNVMLKENPSLFDGLSKDRIIMIGDNLDTDIAFGFKLGINTCLVLTGISTEEDI